MLDPAIRDLASVGKNFGTIAVRLPNGQILSQLMWVDAIDDQLLINTEVHRAKYKAVQQHPEVTVTIWDAENPYRYAEVRGRVVGEVRGDEARSTSTPSRSATSAPTTRPRSRASGSCCASSRCASAAGACGMRSSARRVPSPS